MSGNTQDDPEYKAKAEHKTEKAQVESDDPADARRRWKLAKNMLVAFKTDEHSVS